MDWEEASTLERTAAIAALRVRARRLSQYGFPATSEVGVMGACAKEEPTIVMRLSYHQAKLLCEDLEELERRRRGLA